MASWSEWLTDSKSNIGNSLQWLQQNQQEQLRKIATLRKPDTVIFYASAFLQKNSQELSHAIPIIREDVNGFMNALHGASVDNGLTLILHTPGGDPNAVESIVDYLHSKCHYIEVIVPYLAMSGGAMISLASDLLVLGRQSQIGPIDPQIFSMGKTHSARAIQEGFDQAKRDIVSDTKLAHLWAPILHNMGPSLMVESAEALSYSKELVQNWLSNRMFADEKDEEKKKIINSIAEYFNAEKTENTPIRVHDQRSCLQKLNKSVQNWLSNRMFVNKKDEEKKKIVDGISEHFNVEKTENTPIRVHGQRIGLQKLLDLQVKVEKLEDTQALQEAVMDSYHLMTLIFEKTSAVKFIVSNHGKVWSKNQQQIQQVQMAVPIPQKNSD